MKYFIGIFAMLLGIAVFVWGASLIHYNYTQQRDVIYILKSGKENISAEITTHHSVQAAKDLVVHLSLIVFGIVSVFIAFWLFRKSHNNKIQRSKKPRG